MLVGCHHRPHCREGEGRQQILPHEAARSALLRAPDSAGNCMGQNAAGGSDPRQGGQDLHSPALDFGGFAGSQFDVVHPDRRITLWNGCNIVQVWRTNSMDCRRMDGRGLHPLASAARRPGVASRMGATSVAHCSGPVATIFWAKRFVCCRRTPLQRCTMQYEWRGEPPS